MNTRTYNQTNKTNPTTTKASQSIQSLVLKWATAVNFHILNELQTLIKYFKMIFYMYPQISILNNFSSQTLPTIFSVIQNKYFDFVNVWQIDKQNFNCPYWKCRVYKISKNQIVCVNNFMSTNQRRRAVWFTCVQWPQVHMCEKSKQFSCRLYVYFSTEHMLMILRQYMQFK